MRSTLTMTPMTSYSVCPSEKRIKPSFHWIAESVLFCHRKLRSKRRSRSVHWSLVMTNNIEPFETEVVIDHRVVSRKEVDRRIDVPRS